MVRRLSWQFGLLIGVMWMGEVILGNLSGTPVLGNAHGPGGLAPLFAIAALGCTLLTGFAAAYRTGRLQSAVYVCVWSGLISGAITLVTLITITILFHDAMMQDPSNIHEFARSAHRVPTAAELSHFLYFDALAGALNHLWIGPLLGITIGALGAVPGRAANQCQSDANPEGAATLTPSEK